MYNSNNVAERIKELSASKGIPVKRLLVDTGLGKNTMSNFKTSMPKADNLAKIADYLGCSLDYLLGRDTPTASRLPHSGNNDIDNIVKDLLNKDITPNDIEVIKAVLNKYR